MSAKGNGPYLQTAVICEKALEEKDGVISIIRIIDRITVTYVATDASEQLPEIPINYVLVVSFKSGEFIGEKHLRIMLKGPKEEKAKEKPLFSLPLRFEGNEKGTNIIINNVMQTKTGGIYWFEIYLDQALYTKVPLYVSFLQEKPVD